MTHLRECLIYSVSRDHFYFAGMRSNFPDPS